MTKNNSQKKNGNGAGSTKTIAEREEQSRNAKNRRKQRGCGRAMASEQLAPLQAPTISWTDMIHTLKEGNMLTGTLVDFDGATKFEFVSPDKLLLKSSTEAFFAPHINFNQNVFITFWQVLKEDFASGIANEKAAKKQHLMIERVRKGLGENGLAELGSYIEEKTFKETFIGEDQVIWERAGGSLEDLTHDNFIELRFGEEMESGIVIGIRFDNRIHSCLMVGIGHIGKRHPLSQKVRVGTFIRCNRGQFPETIASENKMAVSASVALHYFLKEMDRVVAEKLMTDMMATCKRLHDMNKEQSATVHVLHVLNEKRTIQAPQFGRAMHTEQQHERFIATSPIPQETAPTSSGSSDSEIVGYIRSLREAGVSGAELGQLVAAYKHATNAKTA
jgi:hypothetical protein